MAHETTSYKTVLFADISGSTQLYEILNDSKAQEIIARCLDEMSNIAIQNNGKVIKTIGDEILCTFDGPDSAAVAAIEMQEAVSAIQYSERNFMSLHIGFHHGEIIDDIDDIFGDTVNIAARVVSKAKSQQVMTTFETIGQMDQEISSKSRLVLHTKMKGKVKAMELYEIVWGEPEDLTVVTHIKDPNIIYDGETSTSELELELNGQTYTVNHNMPLITLGRSDENTIMVNDHKVSRLHARIELRHDRFFFIDQSINGSFVHFETEPTKLVKGFEIGLEKKGYITLAKKDGQKISFCSPIFTH